MDHCCYLCLVFVMLLRLFLAALWSPTWKGLTSWLLFVMFNCVFVTFPCDILGQVWYLIVSIPNLCRLSYFCRPVDNFCKHFRLRSGPTLSHKVSPDLDPNCLTMILIVFLKEFFEKS